MARKKKKRSSSRKKNGSPLIPPDRKREILGLILMVLAVLIALAVVSYAPADTQLARNFSWSQVFDPGSNRAQNALGLVGAKLAFLLVPGFLGYTSLLLTGLLFIWGLMLFRHRKPWTVSPVLISVLLSVGAFVLATLFGWFVAVARASTEVFSGAVGLGVAGWMAQVFGAVGSLILIVVLLVVTILLVIDHDIQRSLDRLEDLVFSFRERLAGWWEQYQARRSERKAAREERRAEKAKAREEARKRRKAALEEARQQEAKQQRPQTPAASSSSPPSSASSPVRSPKTSPSSSSASSARRTLNDQFSTRPPASGGDASPSSSSRPPASSASSEESGDTPSSPESSHEVQDIELKVRERVEEEKADSIDREADPDEDLPYEFPPLDLLDEPDDDGPQVDHEELETNKHILLDKLDTYNIQIDDINAVVGPTVTLYELTPAPGVKISRITSLEDDLAMAMAARGIRIIAPIPGKSAVGVEIPNRHRELVRIRDIIGTVKFRDTEMELPVALGKTIEGEVYLQDLTKMPHLLVAGATGSGKSVGINALITGLLYACPPSHLKFVLIDPKKIELQQYKTLEGHYIAQPEDGDDVVITAFEDALSVLKSCEKEMERRYDLLSKASVRSIREYNRKLHDGALADEHEHLPYIVVIVDELADLMMTAGKDIEGPIARLAQMARAVGIHLVLATQRPSVDVITGLIKANFPSRVAYQVASKIDARTILDQNGAEGLVGNGDLLYMNGSRIVRLQGPFVSINEVDRLVAFVDEQPAPGPYLLPPGEENETSALAEALGVEETDELFDEAARIIVQHQQGSVSLLQRKMAVGYTRAARIVDQLEEAGIVGPFVGSKARDVLVSDLEQLDAFLSTRDDADDG